VNGVQFPMGFRLDRLQKSHSRKAFCSGQLQVDDWLGTKALQHQDKHLFVTKVLLDGAEVIVGYYTLSTGQVDFGDLPTEISKKLPKRILPVAVLSWLGVAEVCQGKGLARLLLAQALLDCYDAGQTFPFIAVVLDCIDEKAKAFYECFDFIALPGYPYRLYLTAAQLKAMISSSE